MPTRPKKRERIYSPPKPTGYNRVASASEYHSERWKRESRAFRTTNPLCIMCQHEGKIAPAEVTDHVVPWPVCKDFFDSSNWQPLCRKHNAIKGNRDKKLITKYKQDNEQ